jgi:hypothetical protein
MGGGRVKPRRTLTVFALAAIAAAPSATAEPVGETWPSDPCQAAKASQNWLGHMFGASEKTLPANGGAPVACLAYPRRIEYHLANCHWVAQAYDGNWRQFEICKSPTGVWRTSGRS